MNDVDDLTHSPIESLAGLAREAFEAAYADQVGDLAAETVLEERSAIVPFYGTCKLKVLVGGLVILSNRKKRFWLFETRARVEEREHLRAWAEFARGRWVAMPPSEAGTYPTRDCEGGRAPDRTFVRVRGALKDTTRGFVSGDKVTEWRGDRWSVPYPKLPGAI